eukprot:4281407-Prymnesium_polylepis.1
MCIRDSFSKSTDTLYALTTEACALVVDRRSYVNFTFTGAIPIPSPPPPSEPPAAPSPQIPDPPGAPPQPPGTPPPLIPVGGWSPTPPVQPPLTPSPLVPPDAPPESPPLELLPPPPPPVEVVDVSLIGLPRISSVSPASGSSFAGTSVTVSGAGFAGGDGYRCRFGGIE